MMQIAYQSLLMLNTSFQYIDFAKVRTIYGPEGVDALQLPSPSCPRFRKWRVEDTILFWHDTFETTWKRIAFAKWKTARWPVDWRNQKEDKDAGLGCV